MTPLERAARAIRDEIAYDHGDGSFIVEGGPRGADFFTEVARAVLQAIREPSEGMVATVSEGGFWFDDRVERYWQAMIDAALEEG